jgi:spermidine synthase
VRRWATLFLAAAAGYVSLTQEMVWMRAVSYVTGGAPSVFAHVLGFFLVGVALGAWIGQRACETAFKDTGRPPGRFLGAMFVVSGLFYYVSIAAVAEAGTRFAGLTIPATYGVVLLTSLLLAALFPVLCHYAASPGQGAGVATSRVYVANIVGSTLGPLLTGFVLMDRLTTAQIVLAVSILSVALGVATLLAEARRNGAMIVASLLAAAVLPLVHPTFYGTFLEKLQYGHRYYPGLRYKYAIENRSGIIAVVEDEAGLSDMLYGGGVYDGNFDVDPVMNSNEIQRAYMIAALHPRPRRVLEVGLASGSWSRAIASDPTIEKHVIVEINPGYLDVIRRYEPQRDLLADPRVSIEIDDGRRWLNRHPDARFDLIVQNTTWHWRSQITNLVSVEYLRLCKRHLETGGVVYLNTTGSEDVARTVADAFKYVVRYENFVAGSDAPFAMTPARIREALTRFEMRRNKVFAGGGEMPEVIHEMSNADLRDVAADLRADSSLRVITDDNMASEYKRTPWRDEKRAWWRWFR